MLEAVVRSYEKSMCNYLKHQPSPEEILNVLTVLSPTTCDLKPLTPDDFLGLSGPSLTVSLQVAAVSGPAVWVPLHLELRLRCGYVK